MRSAPGSRLLHPINEQVPFSNLLTRRQCPHPLRIGSPLRRHRVLAPAPSAATPTPSDGPVYYHDGTARRLLSTEESNRLWFAALKPPMYSVGTNPVLVAAAAVYAQVGSVPGGRCVGLVAAAICIIAWLNLSNDGFDAATGVDAAKPESIVNLLGGQRAPVLAIAFAFLAAGLALLALNLAATGDVRVAQSLGLAIACGYLYQGPPFRLSYQGLGEPLCFVAFGLLATPAFYLALLPTVPTALVAAAIGGGATATATASARQVAVALVPPSVWVLAVLVGITTTVILFCSHFHQIQGDLAAGKLSPLVRLGTARACEVLRVAVALPYVLTALAVAVGVLPPGLVVVVVALSLPPAMALVRYADANHLVPAAIAPLKKFAIKWHLAFDLALIIGLVGSRMLSGAV